MTLRTVGQVLRRKACGSPIRPWFKSSGLQHTTPHGLRHLHATLLLNAGVPVKVVSVRLGHSSTTFTQDPYVEVTERSDRAAALATAQFMTA